MNRIRCEAPIRRVPRDTLRSFLRDFSDGIEAWQNDEPDAAIYRPLFRASETFDATELAALDRISSMAINMAFLREILDRVELPSFDQIPGDEEVAEQDIHRWTIPNTNIEIVKNRRRTQGRTVSFQQSNRRTVAELLRDGKGSAL